MVTLTHVGYVSWMTSFYSIATPMVNNTGLLQYVAKWGHDPLTFVLFSVVSMFWFTIIKFLQ